MRFFGSSLFVLLFIAGGLSLWVCMPRVAVPYETIALGIPKVVSRTVPGTSANRVCLNAIKTHDEKWKKVNAFEVQHASTLDLEKAQRHLLDATAVMIQSCGQEHLQRLREANVQASLQALMQGGQSALQWTGGIHQHLIEYGVLSKEGQLLSPNIVLRVLFFSKWNWGHGLQPTQGMSQSEQHVYWGWLAYESDAETELRESAIQTMEKWAKQQQGSTQKNNAIMLASLTELRAGMLYLLGSKAEAKTAYEQLHSNTLRIRNVLLGLKHETP